MIRAFRLVMVRELTVAFRRWSDLVLPLVFFVIVCTLFPLAVGQNAKLLQEVGPASQSGGEPPAQAPSAQARRL